MAAIANSIKLQDQMSPVFRRIISAMDSTMKVMRALDTQANKGVTSKAYNAAEKEIQRANNALMKMQNNLQNADKQAQNVERTLGRTNTSMNKLGSGGFNLLNLSAALYMFKNISSVVDGIMEKVDQSRSNKARMGAFNTSNYTEEQLYGQALQTAIKSRSSLQATSDLVNRLIVSGALEGQNAPWAAMKTTEIINKATVAGGATAGESERAILQLSQAMSSGILQGDELRAIREQAPYLMKTIAEGLGKAYPEIAEFQGVGPGQMKALGAKGMLTSERIIKAINAQETEVNAKFKLMPRTFSQGMTQISSIWQYFLGLLAQGEGPFKKLTDSLWRVADFLASERGDKFLAGIAWAIGEVVDGILWMFDLLGRGVRWLKDNIEVAQAAILTLGTVLAIVTATAIVGFIAANWQLLSVVLAVYLVILALLKAGVSMGQIIGGVLYALAFTGALVADIFIGIIDVVWWTVLTIWNAIMFVSSFVVLFFGGVAGTLQEVMAGAVDFIWKLVSGILSGIIAVQSLVDKVMGTTMAADLTVIKERVDNSFSNAYDSVPSGYETWEATMDLAWNKMPYSGVDAYNPSKNLDNAFGKLNEWAANPFKEGKAAYDWGNGAGESIEKFNLQAELNKAMGDFTGSFEGAFPDSLSKVDEVGKIGSDVDISDEDLKLLRDVAAREFLLNLQSISPTAKISFGDVHETADVNQIMGILEAMVEEALATSLVQK